MSDLAHHSPFSGEGVALPLGPHLPPGFEDTFGPLPKISDFPSGEYRQWGAAVGSWITNLGLFAESGRKTESGESKPSWASDAQVAKANEKLDQFGVPHPKYFRFNFRAEDPRATGEWQAMFPVPGRSGWFQCAASSVIPSVGFAILGYQEDCLQRGIDPTGGDRSKRHPYIREWPGDPKQPDSEHEG